MQHDGGATPDNFLNALHDALIKNYKKEIYDHLALADQFDFAEDAKSATFRLRENIQFHDGSPVTPEDVKWSYEHYHGAWAKVLHDQTDRINIVDKRTIRFDFKTPFLDFPRLMGTANVCGAAWVVPAKYYEKVGRDGFVQKPIGAGPYKLVAAGAGHRTRIRGLRRLLRAGARQRVSRSVSVPDAATRRRDARPRRGRHHLLSSRRAGPHG